MKNKVYISLLIIAIALMSSCSEKKKTTEVKQVSKPYFNLNSGYFISQDTLKIFCDMDDVEIRFTSDGSEPNANSNIYQAPIAFNQTRVFKAKAFKDGWEPSATAFIRLTMNVANIAEIPLVGRTFTMGRTKGDGDPDELPTHQVSIDGFTIAKYETIFSEWLSVMGVYSSSYGILANGINAQPVSYVSWYDAIKYCNLLSMAKNRTPVYTIKGKTNPDEWGPVPTFFDGDWDAVTCNWTANGYRLPTEAEWEFAARAEVNNPDYLYSGSDTFEDVGWSYENGSGNVHVGGLLTANTVGVHDMSGNLWEWCWDRRNDTYYASSPTSNPRGPNTGIYRVLRGGSIDSDVKNCRVAERNFSVPYHKELDIGFRVVRGN